MRRVMSLWLPSWPIDRLRRLAGRAPGKGDPVISPFPPRGEGRLAGARTMLEENARQSPPPLRGRAGRGVPAESLASRQPPILTLPRKGGGDCCARQSPTFSGGEETGVPGRPFVTAVTIANRRLVAAASPEAAACGIVPGLPLADAQAYHPGLAVREADPAGDAAALHRLAEWCGRWSPWTAPDGVDGILIDVTGCAHLHGGEARLAAAAVGRLGELGYACRGAIADTAGAAWALA